MSDVPDPRCPECGEPIGIRATYCMHCSADLTEERTAADADGDGAWDDGTETRPTDTTSGWSDSSDTADEPLLDPDGLLDNSLTVVVGIVGGIVIGLVATVTLVFLSAGILAVLGPVIWVGATAYLVRQRTVQGAVSKAAYGVAVVLLLVPLVPLSPAVDTDPAGRAVGVVVLLLMFGILAGIAAGVGYLAARFVPEEAG